MKHRGSGKIQAKHSMIKGLYKLLQKIEHFPEIKAIIPGRISPSKNCTELHLTVQYLTKSGIKLLAKGDGSVQELFITASEPEALIRRLKNYERTNK
jgi:hypothetical protein